MYVFTWLTFDCLQQVRLSCCAQCEMEIRDRWIKRVRCLHFEICLCEDGSPPEALRLCPPLSPFSVLIYVFVCVSGGKSMVFVLLSVSNVSLVYHRSPLAPSTQLVLSVSPQGQPMNPTALRLRKPSWKKQLHVFKKNCARSAKV